MRDIPPYDGGQWIRRHILEHFPELEQPGGAVDDRNVLARLVAERRAAMRVSRSGETIDFALLVERDKLNTEQKRVVTMLFGEHSCFTSRSLRPPVGTTPPRSGSNSASCVPVVGFSVAIVGTIFYFAARYFGIGPTSGCLFFLLLTVIPVAIVATISFLRLFSSPHFFLLMAVVTAALPVGAAAAYVSYASLENRPATAVLAGLAGLAGSALLLRSARISSEDHHATRRRVVAASRIAARHLRTNRTVRQLGIVVTPDGFRPIFASIPIIRLFALFFIGGCLWAAWPQFPAFRPLVGILAVCVALAFVKSAADLRLAMRPIKSTLSAGPKRPYRRPQRDHPFDPTRYPIKSSGVTAGVAWEATAHFENVQTDDGPEEDCHTVWRTTEGATAGTLQFWPRWPEVFDPPFAQDHGAVPPWYMTAAFALARGAGAADLNFGSLSRLPLDDEQFVKHYRVFSTADLGPHHISPTLKEALLRFANAVHGRADPPPSLRSMRLIMFWPRGLMIYSSSPARDDAELQELARFGAVCANALRA